MSKKSQKPNQNNAPPRDLKTITTDFSRAAQTVGQSSYQIDILQKEITAQHWKMKQLNLEASARQKLDAEKTPQSATTVSLPESPTQSPVDTNPTVTEGTPNEQ
jgi:hypothetical protein